MRNQWSDIRTMVCSGTFAPVAKADAKSPRSLNRALGCQKSSRPQLEKTKGARGTWRQPEGGRACETGTSRVAQEMAEHNLRMAAKIQLREQGARTWNRESHISVMPPERAYAAIVPRGAAPAVACVAREHPLRSQERDSSPFADGCERMRQCRRSTSTAPKNELLHERR